MYDVAAGATVALSWPVDSCAVAFTCVAGVCLAPWAGLEELVAGLLADAAVSFVDATAGFGWGEPFSLELPEPPAVADDLAPLVVPLFPAAVVLDLLKKSNSGGSTGVPRKHRNVRKSSVLGRMLGSSSGTCAVASAPVPLPGPVGVVPLPAPECVARFGPSLPGVVGGADE